MSEKVNLRPDSFAEGGGLIDDFDGTISDVRFIMTDYDGAIRDAVPVAKVSFDVEGEESFQLYSVGGSNDFAPDETGMGLTVLKGKSALTKKSKFGMLLDSLVAVGFPLNKMDTESIAYLVGFDGHFLRKPVEYAGLKKKDDRDSTVLLCTKVNQLPWENTGKGKKSGKAKAKPVDEELADTMAGIIQGIIIEKDGEVSKKDALSALFKNDDVKALDDKKAALKLASDDTFLKGRDEWTFEDGLLKMA